MDNIFWLFYNLTKKEGKKERKLTVTGQSGLTERDRYSSCDNETNNWNEATFVLGQALTRQQWHEEINVVI
jgi:hypothetical protein